MSLPSTTMASATATATTTTAKTKKRDTTILTATIAMATLVASVDSIPSATAHASSALRCPSARCIATRNNNGVRVASSFSHNVEGERRLEAYLPFHHRRSIRAVHLRAEAEDAENDVVAGEGFGRRGPRRRKKKQERNDDRAMKPEEVMDANPK